MSTGSSHQYSSMLSLQSHVKSSINRHQRIDDKWTPIHIDNHQNHWNNAEIKLQTTIKESKDGQIATNVLLTHEIIISISWAKRVLVWCLTGVVGLRLGLWLLAWWAVALGCGAWLTRWSLALGCGCWSGGPWGAVPDRRGGPSPWAGAVVVVGLRLGLWRLTDEVGLRLAVAVGVVGLRLGLWLLAWWAWGCGCWRGGPSPWWLYPLLFFL